MCKETRINSIDLHNHFNTIYSEDASIADSTTFGVTSSASDSGKKIAEENTILLSSTNTPPPDNIMPQQHQEDEDPHDTMITFLTGRTKSERSSKERAIIFPVKVSLLVSLLYPRIFYRLNGWLVILTLAVSF